MKHNKITKEEKEYIQTLSSNVSKAVNIFSKGKIWIDIKDEGIKLEGDDIAKDIIKEISTMFHDRKSKKFDVDKFNNGMNYFGHKITAKRENDDKISFNGDDIEQLFTFLYFMGDIPEKDYAEILRKGPKGFIAE